MQLHGELATMTAERSNVSGALLAKLYGRPEEEAGLFTGKASRIRDLAVANAGHRYPPGGRMFRRSMG